ncbi:MAG TPA: glycosyltransferase family 4 protein [Gaiellaceae bacterium]|jgi:phosphatidylinositol alpha-mannosyltransferase
MRVGIVIPYSWSFWGAVVEHTESQAEALSAKGIEVVRIMGLDPPGQFSRALHPRMGRVGDPPSDVMPIGRSVIVPANDSLPNIILSPRTVFRMRRILREEKFDLLHLHEPITPIPCVAALALSDLPMVGTFHAAGGLNWNRGARPAWGYLLDRLDRRLAVSQAAKESAERWYPGDYELVPNGTVLGPSPNASDRLHQVVFGARHEKRKGLAVLLRAWPDIRRRTGLKLRLAGAEPMAVRLLISRLRMPDDGIEILGFLPQEKLTEELSLAKASIAPAIGGESFGMQLTRAFGCATPVVASDIDGYREVMRPGVGLTVPPEDPQALADAVVDIISDEPRRVAMGEMAYKVAASEYGWDALATKLISIYESVLTG